MKRILCNACFQLNSKLFCKNNCVIYHKRTVSGSAKFAKCPQQVFSGIQPTGIPHLGNYVGAIQSWVSMQHRYDNIILSIVDLHSITVPQDPKILRENIFSMTACLLACGVDPSKTILFQQSMVPQHSELSWILGCLCTLPRLHHLPQWKEKSEKMKEPGVGLFTYPILQSADILLYKATHVPVGEDQIHHIELTRHLARTFNRMFSVVFPSCSAMIGERTKIKSLRDGTKKMSKSEANPLGRIDLTDSCDVVHEKLRKSMSDSTSVISYSPDDRPGISNLIDIHSALTGLSPDQIVEENQSLNKIEYKAKVADVINGVIQPISDEVTKLLDDKHHLEAVLELGAEKAQAIAARTIKEVKHSVGFS